MVENSEIILYVSDNQKYFGSKNVISSVFII